MDYGQKNLADRLASDYCLGTMRGGTRRRMESLMLAHPALRKAVANWDATLYPLAESVKAVAPPPRVWQNIEQRLFGKPQAQNTAWWRKLGVWQGLSAALASVLVASAMVLSTQVPQPSQPSQTAAAAPVIIVLNASDARPDGQAMAFAASYAPQSKVLVIRPVEAPKLANGKTLELWALPPGGAPRSLGLIGALQTTQLKGMTDLNGIQALAVSVEPSGGAPHASPTGPIVSVGKLQI